jgi:hypothetical protein
MDWARVLAYVTGTVDQELLARNEYLAAENGIRDGSSDRRPLRFTARSTGVCATGADSGRTPVVASENSVHLTGRQRRIRT